MNFHLAAGQLNEDAPEVWGFLRFSKHAGLWFVDWYSAGGDIEGATLADAEAYRWAESHPEELAAEWEQIKAWQLARWHAKPRPPILDDDIPF